MHESIICVDSYNSNGMPLFNWCVIGIWAHDGTQTRYGQRI